MRSIVWPRFDVDVGNADGMNSFENVVSMLVSN